MDWIDINDKRKRVPQLWIDINETRRPGCRPPSFLCVRVNPVENLIDRIRARATFGFSDGGLLQQRVWAAG